MKCKTLAVLFACALVSGCFGNSAPEVEDTANIVIDGSKYSADGYLEAFCNSPEMSDDKNCIKVRDYLRDRVESYNDTSSKHVEW